MTNTPPDWVLIEAAKRSEYGVDNVTLMYTGGGAFRALCDMILKHEQPPVDRKVLCAKEAVNLSGGDHRYSSWFRDLMQEAAVRAIELWEEGFGK